MNIIFTSYGNDSLAVMLWALDNGVKNIVAAYSDTQWAAREWSERINRIQSRLSGRGIEFVKIESEGFAGLAKRKKAFPANGMGFCTYELKIKPSMEWLELVDPEKLAVCYTGVMRIESERRKNWPIVVDESPNHGGRKLISPLADKTLEFRNGILEGHGFEVLPHRSKECSPCINATIGDIQTLSESDILKVEGLEREMGVGKVSSKPKYMFRPHRMQGAKGIRQVKEWADHGGGKYNPLQDDLFGCDSGFCGA